MKYAEMTKEQLEQEYSVIRARYDGLCEEKLSLNLTRGKPEKKQLDLSNGMYTALKDCDFEMDGIDVRMAAGARVVGGAMASTFGAVGVVVVSAARIVASASKWSAAMPSAKSANSAIMRRL